MTTIPTTAPTQHKITDCPWCQSKAFPAASDAGRQHRIVCQSHVACGATGPKRATEAEAIAAWNAVRMFGRVGIVHGRAGVPNETTALAEHIRLLSEQVACGAYDNPDAFVVILVTSKSVERLRIHAATHNIDAGGVAHVCNQVHQSASVRNTIQRIGQPKPRST